MANTLRFKRGLASGIPTGVAGEPLFTTDTFDLYIGNGTSNTRFQKYIASGTTSQLLRGDGSLLTMPIVLTSPATGQVLKFNGTNWVNDSDAGITGSGSAGQVAYFTGATTQAGTNNFFWDATNNRLGISIGSPTAPLHVLGGTALTTGIFSHTGTDGAIDVRNTGTLASSRTSQIRLTNGTTFFGANDRSYQLINIGRSSSASDFYVQYFDGTSYFDRFRVFGSTGNFGINTGATDSGQRLQVVGTGYFSDTIGIGSTSLTTLSSIRASRNISSDGSYGIYHDGQIQTAVTGNGGGYINVLQTIANTTLTNYYHYRAIEGTIGATTAITNNFGYHINDMATGTNRFGYYGNVASGTNKWNLYMNGTANNYMAGNLGVGVPVPVPYTVGSRCINILSSNANSEIKLTNSTTGNAAGAGMLLAQYGVNSILLNANAGYLLFGTSDAEAARITSSRNFHIGTFSADSGERLQVTGTMRVTGASSFGGKITLALNQNAETNIEISNTTSGTSSSSRVTFTSTSSGSIGKMSSGLTTYKTLVASDYFLYNATAGDISILNDFASGNIKFAAGGSSTAQMLLNASGNLGLAVTPSAWGSNYKVYDASYTTLANEGASFGQAILANNAYNDGTSASPTWKFKNAANANMYIQDANNAARHSWFTSTASGSANGAITFTRAMTLTANSRLLLNQTSDTGEQLQVTGTARITGATTFGAAVTGFLFNITGNTLGTASTRWIGSDGGANGLFLNAPTGGNVYLAINNNNVVNVQSTGATITGTLAVGGTATFLNPSSVNIVGTATLVGATARNTSSASGNTQCGFYLENGTSNGQLYKAGTGYTTLKTIAANDLGFYNAAAGNISILNDFSSGSIILTAGGSSTAQWTIGANGDLTAADGENIIVGSTNGTKIGTAATQKIGFWNATPIAQPNNSVAAANYVAGIGSAVTTLDAFDGYTIGQVVKALRNAGILS
jgi:hypothetical protein